MREVVRYNKRLRGVVMHKLASDYLTWSKSRFWAEVIQYRNEADHRELLAHQDWWERCPDEPPAPPPEWYPRRPGQLG